MIARDRLDGRGPGTDFEGHNAMRRILSVALLLGILAGASPLSAQSPDTTRGIVGINAGAQASSISVADATTFTQFVEDGTFGSAFEVGPAMLFDAGVAARLWRRLGIGVSASRFQTTGNADVSLDAPHPFFFDQPRRFSEAPELERQTVAVHLAAAYLVPTNGRVQVIISGGPTIFSLTQDLVSDVAFDEQFPFDELVNPRAIISRESETAVGFNAGIDVGVRLGSRWGVGFLARYARATVELSTSGDTAGDRVISTDIGGFHIGGGLRLFF